MMWYSPAIGRAMTTTCPSSLTTEAARHGAEFCDPSLAGTVTGGVASVIVETSGEDLPS